jgi:hypothetical protein
MQMGIARGSAELALHAKARAVAEARIGKYIAIHVASWLGAKANAGARATVSRLLDPILGRQINQRRQGLIPRPRRQGHVVEVDGPEARPVLTDERRYLLGSNPCIPHK